MTHRHAEVNKGDLLPDVEKREEGLDSNLFSYEYSDPKKREELDSELFVYHDGKGDREVRAHGRITKESRRVCPLESNTKTYVFHISDARGRVGTREVTGWNAPVLKLGRCVEDILSLDIYVLTPP